MKKLLLFILLTPLILCSQTQIGQDINGENTDDRSGQGVTISADGTVVAIGAYMNNGNGNQSGHVRIYENIGGVWTQIGSNIESDQAGDGSRVTALSADGKIIAIGAPSYHGGSLVDAGRVRIFKIIDGVWTQLGSDINGDNVGDGAGFGLDISSDGTVVAVGAINNNVVNFGTGQVKIFKFTAGNWTQIGTDIYGEAPSDGACRLSLSEDGSTLAIGAPENYGNGKKSGHVRVFDLSTILSVNSYVSSNFSLFPNPSRNEVRIY